MENLYPTEHSNPRQPRTAHRLLGDGGYRLGEGRAIGRRKIHCDSASTKLNDRCHLDSLLVRSDSLLPLELERTDLQHRERDKRRQLERQTYHPRRCRSSWLTARI